MLNLPNNVKELRHFLGMVQYYQDMWVRCSEMPAPLTDLVGECGETKTTRMNKSRKNIGGGIWFIYSKRDSLSLSGLFEALWDLRGRLLNAVGSRDHSG